MSPAFKFCIYPYLENFICFFKINNPSTQCKNICIIMHSGHFGHFTICTQSTSDSFESVSRNRYPYSGSTNYNTLLTKPIGIAIPPSYLDSFFSTKKRWLQLLIWKEKWLSSRFLAKYADHFLILFEKK